MNVVYVEVSADWKPNLTYVSQKPSAGANRTLLYRFDFDTT